MLRGSQNGEVLASSHLQDPLHLSGAGLSQGKAQFNSDAELYDDEEVSGAEEEDYNDEDAYLNG